MSQFRCPYCDSSEIYEDFNGQALRCGNCEEFGTEEDFMPCKKANKIRRVKKFDDEMPIEDESNTEDQEQWPEPIQDIEEDYFD